MTGVEKHRYHLQHYANGFKKIISFILYQHFVIQNQERLDETPKTALQNY